MIVDNIFVPICGFSDYGINRKGEIFSFKNNMLMKQSDSVKGYKQVCFTVNGHKITKRVHRLVAEAFLINPLNKPQVNHIDGNKKNNCVENLEWCTNSENQIHSYRILKRKNCGGGGGKIPVLCIENGNVYISVSSAGVATNAKATNISRACKNNKYTAGGYHWKYINGGRKYGNS